jgi:hypothetical protein
VDAWQSIRWDPRGRWVDTRFLEIASSFRQILASRGFAEQEGESLTVQPARLRGCEVASSKTRQGRSQLNVDLSRLGGLQREAQEFDSQTNEGVSCERC